MTFIFCLHYFLWYGAHTTIYGYESVYSRYYTNATTIQFGTLKMILPFVAVIVTPMVCSLADRKRLHRTYFTLALLLAALSMVAFCVLPLITNKAQQQLQQQIYNKTTTFDETYKNSDSLATSNNNNQLLVWPFIFFSLTSLIYELAFAVNTCLSDSFAVLQAEESGTTFGKIIVWGTLGWALAALILSLINQLPYLPRLLPGIIMGALMLTIDLVVCAFWRRQSDFKLDAIEPSVALTLTGNSSSGHQDPSDYLPLNETNRVNIGSFHELNSTQSEPRGKSPIGSLAKRRKTISPMELISKGIPGAKQFFDCADKSLAIKMVPAKEIEVQNQRVSSMSPLQSDIKTINSEMGTMEQTVKFEATDPYASKPTDTSSLATIVMDLDKARKETLPSVNCNKKNSAEHQLQQDIRASFWLQLKLVSLIVVRRGSFVRLLILFVLSGFFMSMHWNYFFLYLETIHPDKFELISALSMVHQAILGELPFFILSRWLIDTLGRSHTISLSLISISLRFLLYRFMLPYTSGFLTVVADCLQGPNYGLFYVVMTEVGLEYSYCDDELIEYLALRKLIDRNNVHQVDSVRLALRSTIQSVAFACYEGLGVGLGGLIGGWILSKSHFNNLWLAMAISSLLVGLVNIAIEFSFGELSFDEAEEEEENGEQVNTGGGAKNCLPGDVLAKWPSDWRDFHLAQRSGQLERISSGPLLEWKSTTTVDGKQQPTTAGLGGRLQAAVPVHAAGVVRGTASAADNIKQREQSQVGKLVANAVAALKVAEQAKSAAAAAERR